MTVAALYPEHPSFVLDELCAMTADELDIVYRRGASFPITALDGQPHGRMLALVGLRGTSLRAVARLARSHLFPWRGKSFTSVDGEAGRGVNRVKLGKVHSWYPFTTRHEPSAIDGQPCVRLDYGAPVNPWFIRPIRDELREVGPDLYLGPAMLETRSNARLVLWFAIDTSR